MTQSESAVPVAERALFIEGVASSSALQQVDQRGDFEPDDRSAALFLSFAYADLPIGWSFTHVWSADDPNTFEKTDGAIGRCTQQFGRPFDEVPHGWKTIVLFHFEPNVPAMVKALPELDSWSYRPVLRFGSEEAWRAAASAGVNGGSTIDLRKAVEKVEDEASLLHFLQLLAEDRAVDVDKDANQPANRWGPDAGGWENGTIEGFLSAAAAWGTASVDGLTFYEVPQNPWRRCADILLMGKHYE